MLLGLDSRNTVGIQQQVMYKRSMKVLDCDTILSRAWPRVICQPVISTRASVVHSLCVAGKAKRAQLMK